MTHTFTHVSAVRASPLTDHSLVCLAGILFSTLVFGPACGFILGSVCTKVYVDAVFIDTSEFIVLFFFNLEVVPSIYNSYSFVTIMRQF